MSTPQSSTDASTREAETALACALAGKTVTAQIEAACEVVASGSLSAITAAHLFCTASGGGLTLAGAASEMANCLARTYRPTIAAELADLRDSLLAQPLT